MGCVSDGIRGDVVFIVYVFSIVSCVVVLVSVLFCFVK